VVEVVRFENLGLLDGIRDASLTERVRTTSDNSTSFARNDFLETDAAFIRDFQIFSVPLGSDSSYSSFKTFSLDLANEFGTEFLLSAFEFSLDEFFNLFLLLESSFGVGDETRVEAELTKTK
jgi:hypothetical protein